MSIDKSKRVERLNDRLKHYAKFKGSIADTTVKSNIVTKILNEINSGDFDCEAVKSEWKPTKNIGNYYTPYYEYSTWSICEEPLWFFTKTCTGHKKLAPFYTSSDSA